MSSMLKSIDPYELYCILYRASTMIAYAETPSHYENEIKQHKPDQHDEDYHHSANQIERRLTSRG